MQELLGTYMSPNARVNVINATTVEVPAGTGNDQVGLTLSGRWRYNVAAVQATHPGGAAGTYNLWATGSDNVFVPGTPETDSTVYAFALQILAVGATPGTALSRLIGTVQWNGSGIQGVTPISAGPVRVVDGTPTIDADAVLPGDLVWAAGPTRPGCLACDGASYLRASWPALFAALGGASSLWGLPDGTHFNVPDLRGRVPIGAGTGPGLTARTLAQTGGEESHLLTAAESGLPSHTHPSGGGVNTGYESNDHSHLIDVGMVARFSTLFGATNPAIFGDQYGSETRATGGVSANHFHYGTDPATPAQGAANAAAAHANMQPWMAFNAFVKT
jgi:microcystin-dependent protein